MRATHRIAANAAETPMTPSQMRSSHGGRYTPSLLSMLGILLLSAGSAFAQTATPAPSPYLLAQTNSGTIINNACIWTYIAGTTTAAFTYTDQTAGTPNANPIRSDSAGRFVAWLLPGNSYKFVYETACTPPSHGTVLVTKDNIPAVPTSGTSVDYQGTAGENLTLGQVAYLSDGSGGKTGGQWYRADSANSYSSTTPTIGIVTASVVSSGTVTVRGTGRLTGLSALSVGSAYYVGTTGAITTTAPANTRFVGHADTTTSLDIAANPAPVSAAPTVQTTTSTGTQNNFSATAARRLVLYANNATALTITGLTAGSDGDQITVIKIGAGSVTLTEQDTGSTAANRIVTADGAIGVPAAATLTYSTTLARWQVTAQAPLSAVAYPVTLATVSNTASLSTLASWTVPTMADGDVIEATCTLNVKQNTGGGSTVTWTFAYGGSSVASSAVTASDDPATYKQMLRFVFQRVGANLELFSNTGSQALEGVYMRNPTVTNQNNTLTVSAPTFTSAQTMAIKVTLGAASANFSYTPTSCSVVHKKGS